MFTIYHNPRCSKSRNTLTLLDDNNIDYKIVHYLNNPPSVAELKALLTQLNVNARDIIRTGESDYKQQQLSNPDLSEDTLIEAMVNAPKLIERPIVSNGTKAIIGRPPEKVFELIR